VLVPAALENQITEENADKLQCSYIVEAANGPTSKEADAIFAQSEYLSDSRRNILVNAIRERINLIGELI
jgi:glutamate dehydrogenase/leucine dehydrogenase